MKYHSILWIMLALIIVSSASAVVEYDWYKFDTSFIDYGTAGNNLISHDSITLDNLIYKVGNASMHASGGSSYVYDSPATMITGNSDRSVCWWTYISGTQAGVDAFWSTSSMSSTRRGFQFVYDYITSGGQYTLQTFDDNPGFILPNPALNRWDHRCLIYTGNHSVYLYQNAYY